MPSVPRFRSHQWNTDALVEWSSLQRNTEELKHRAAQGPSFTVYLDRAREILSAPHPESNPELHDRRVGRAAVVIWFEEESAAEQSMRIETLDAVLRTQQSTTRLMIYALANVYFKYFDRLDKWQPGLFSALSEHLIKVVKGKKRNLFPDVVDAIRKHRRAVIGANAPTTLAERVIKSDMTLAEHLAAMGMRDYVHGRFADAVRQRVYLTRIAKADPAENHDFLAELTEDAVCMAPAPDRRFFGHWVLEAMTAPGVRHPHVEWQNTVLDIAGDPRLRHTGQWRTWWEPVSQRCRETVISWLATQDLKLFLDAVEDFGDRSYDTQLQRMFPDRKQFLEGLHDLGLIRETRLFAGNRARSAIRETLGNHLNSSITAISGAPDLSAIFIDCGRFHLVEGSHNFKLKIFIGEPVPTLTDRSTTRIGFYDLRDSFLERFSAQNPYDSFTNIVHSQHRWISEALEFLALHGIAIRPERVMSKHTYSIVKQRYGLPVVKK